MWGLRKGSGKPQMTDPLRIFTVYLAEQGSQLAVPHVPGKENVRADQLSRTPDQDHYSLRQDAAGSAAGCMHQINSCGEPALPDPPSSGNIFS